MKKENETHLQISGGLQYSCKGIKPYTSKDIKELNNTKESQIDIYRRLLSTTEYTFQGQRKLPKIAQNKSQQN